MKYFCIRILDTQCMIFKYIYVNKIDYITIIILCGGRVGSIGMLTLITYWPETLFSLSFSLKGFIYGSHLLHALNIYKWLILRTTAGYSAKSLWKHICAEGSKNPPGQMGRHVFFNMRLSDQYRKLSRNNVLWIMQNKLGLSCAILSSSFTS